MILLQKARMVTADLLAQAAAMVLMQRQTAQAKVHLKLVPQTAARMALAMVETLRLTAFHGMVTMVGMLHTMVQAAVAPVDTTT